MLVAAKIIGKDQKLSSKHITTKSMAIKEQLKSVHKMVDIVQTPKKDLLDFTEIEFGPANELSCSRPSTLKREEGGQVSTNCLCEISTQKICLFARRNDFWIR